MNCSHCLSTQIYALKKKTQLGYRQYSCRSCMRQYNERTGTLYNFLHYPTDVVLLTVFYYYRFKNSLDDVVEQMALRGFSLSHETVRLWVQQFGTELGIKMCTRRYGHGGKKWHADATYLRMAGRWCYLYRAMDKAGNLIDVYLSDCRDQAAADAFFAQCHVTAGVCTDQITTDKEPALKTAIKKVFGQKTTHRDSQFMNNRIEQDHRGIKARAAPMKGFKRFWCAMIFCHGFEEIRQFFRMAGKTRAEKRSLFAPRFQQYLQLAYQIT